MQSLGKALLFVLLALSILGISFQLGKHQGIAEGRSMAMKEMLRTNPPSEELEMVCAGLWIGEQNKKHHEKNK